jgi:pimeloyl-ACP methyl ester carboxylesterase
MRLYDAALAHWPVAHHTMNVHTRHGDTFVIACDEDAAGAPPMILLHGAGSNAATWMGEVRKYSRLHRVYAVDLLGKAGKSAPVQLSWNGPAYAEWLLDVLDALQLDRPTLMGVSQGGWLALKLATWQPGRVGKLVLLSPGGVTPDRLSFALHALAASVMGPRGVERTARSLFGDAPAPPEAFEVVYTLMSHFKTRVGKLPLFADEQLLRLSMPVMLLVGAHDPLRPAERIAARMQALLPHLVTQVVPKAGHVLLNTTPYIMPFLAATEMKTGEDAEGGRYHTFVRQGMSSQAQDVDRLMSALTEDDLPTLKLADFALGLVNRPEGSLRIKHYLFNGSQRQRNYAALYFKRRGNALILQEALSRGVIDQEQACAE